MAACCSDPSLQFVVGAMDKQSLLALFSGAANSGWSLEEDVQVFPTPAPETSPPILQGLLVCYSELP